MIGKPEAEQITDAGVGAVTGQRVECPALCKITRVQTWLDTLQRYMAGVHEDDLLEAMHRAVVDLLDQGHIPPPHALRLISGALKLAWWPDPKQSQHSKEFAFMASVPEEINYLAAEKYGGARGARTKAEQDVAKAHGISVEALRKRLERFRARRKEREAKLERRRKRPLRKQDRFSQKVSVDRR
jgi:hypothetical protein